MRILQGNIHRSRTADNLLAQLRLELKIDLLILSEQYKDRNGPGWYADNLGTAAIWVPEAGKVTFEDSGAGRGFVWTKIDKVTYVSCYFTPNESILEFQEKLDELEDTLRDIEGVFIVAGDFNAKALEWGMETTDRRGRCILEMADRLGLNVANVGNTTTFRRPGYGETIPDITLVSELISSAVADWRVIEEYTGSDHQYITFNLLRARRVDAGNHTRPARWNVSKLNRETLIAAIDRGKASALKSNGPARTLADATMGLIRRACDASMPRKKSLHGKKKPVYWWTEDIARLRRRCLQLRRRITRVRRRSPETAEVESIEFRDAKKELKRAIIRSKKLKWEELRQDVNKDPWGLGYRTVMRKLGAKSAGSLMEATQTEAIVDALFPTHKVRALEGPSGIVGEVPLFSAEELAQASGSMQNGKAPGPDGIPTEVLKEIARFRPQLLLNMYNRCLSEGIFHERWKRQRLVLVNKGKGDPNSPSAYRPLCMLDTAGKLLERLLKPRLAAAVRRAGDLSERQHGFRKGHSTVNAIEQVVTTFHAAQQGNHYSRKIVLLATLDVRNAFNSVSWTVVLSSLENIFKVPHYLLRIIQSYLRDRELMYDTAEGPRRRKITAGAAQGSILGPDLWNASYDGILRMEMPEGAFLIGYADDIAVVIVARDTDGARRRLNQVMRRVFSWLEEHGLSLAAEKTEIVLLTRRRIPTEVQMMVGPETITTKKVVKYLGVKLDTKLTFWEHIKGTSEKAAKITSALSRLMANVGGPMASRRRLLMSVTHSILLYGCEIWADALNQEKYRRRLAAIQRRGALRVASAYRTVSEPAALVVAGVIPIKLMAQERRQVYQEKKMRGEADTAEARQNTMRHWQECWERESRGRWTARLVGNLGEWSGRKFGEVNFYLTQLLTDHGYFRAYLHRMGKVGSAACQYGDSDTDDAKHTFFECARWTHRRLRLMQAVGHVTPDNIIRTMLIDPDHWDAVAAFVEDVLRLKKSEES